MMTSPVNPSLLSCCVVVLLLGTGCGSAPADSSDDAGIRADGGTLTDAGGGQGDAGTQTDGGGFDSSNAGLTDFVATAAYTGAGWVAEPAVHPDRGGPHGMVRIYFNDVLHQSLKAGNAVHPRGSMVLKETYSSDGQTLRGHMLDVKDVDENGVDQWVWWYRPNATSGTAPTYFRGTDNFCASCHASGKDYVRAAAP